MHWAKGDLQQPRVQIAEKCRAASPQRHTSESLQATARMHAAQTTVSAQSRAALQQQTATQVCFQSKLPCNGLTVDRRQFPLRPCNTMAVNTSKGQTLGKVCLDLKENPFAHGQLYLGSGHVRKGSDILVLARAERLDDDHALTNWELGILFNVE